MESAYRTSAVVLSFEIKEGKVKSLSAAEKGKENERIESLLIQFNSIGSFYIEWEILSAVVEKEACLWILLTCND